MAIPEEIQRQVLAEATSATPNYDIDMNDPAFKQVDQSMENTWNEYNQTVGGMISNTDKYYEDLKNQSKEWADKQAQIQQDNTDFAIEKIEQQKEQAQKDYIKEQSGAYVDWRKQSNQYGTEAEKMASAGLSQTGFSESSQVSMYNTYQNRVATAREVIAQAKLNYDNNIKEAMLQNNAALAQIYADAHKEQLELALQGFQYKNQLVLDLADKKIEIENIKWNRYQDILDQMNTQNALKEQVREFNERLDFEAAENQKDRDHQEKLKQIEHDFDVKLEAVKHDYQIKYLNASTEKEKEMLKEKWLYTQKQIEAEKQAAIAKENAKIQSQLKADKELASYTKSLNSSSISGGSSSKSGGSSSKSGGSSNKKVTTSYSTTSYKQKATLDEVKQHTPPIDMKSVTALGFGPISASKLNDLVKNGIVQEYVSGGKTKFRLTASGLKQQQLNKRLG